MRYTKHNARLSLAWGAIALSLVAMASLISCVPKGEKREVLAPRGQLVHRAQTFNRFLRWKAFDRAKMLVAPKKRSFFMLEWERDRPHIRITDFRVRDVTETKKGKKAIVLVVIHRHRLPSVSLKRILEQQRWESEGGYWFFVGIKEGKIPAKKAVKKVTAIPAKVTAIPAKVTATSPVKAAVKAPAKTPVKAAAKNPAK